MHYLDLGEVETKGHPGFKRADHFGDPSRSLVEQVREQVLVKVGIQTTGPIYLLTHLRQAGYVFNPVSFYYCWSADGQTLQAILAEVHNTPWGETHLYAIPVKSEFKKAFHVSPFMPMNQRYRWSFNAPGERLAVHMKNFQDGRQVFDATLALTRRADTRFNRIIVGLKHPLQTYAVIGRIYFQALRLWAKGCPYQPHPAKLQQVPEAN
jgi:DUF1365 family protein